MKKAKSEQVKEQETEEEPGVIPALTEPQIKAGIAEANRDRIASEALPEVLARLRAGDLDALKRMFRGFMFLVWDRISRHRDQPRLYREEMVTELTEDLLKMLERLAKPDNTTLAADVERQIRQELCFSTKHYLEDTGPNIPADRNDGKGIPVTRTSEHPERERWAADPEESIDPLHDPLAPLPLRCPDGSLYRVPSKYEQEMPDDRQQQVEQQQEDDLEAAAQEHWRQEEFERLGPHAEGQFEKLCLEYFGSPSDQSAAKLRDVSHRRIKQALDRLRDRANRQ